MGLFLEIFLPAFMALVACFIIAKLVSFVVPSSSSSEENILDGMIGVEEIKLLDKGLKVERSKSKKKRVKFVDDDVVVVRNIDHFESSEKPIKDFQLCESMCEKVGILDKSLEAVCGFEGEGVDKESELMTCGDGNMEKDVKGDDIEGEKGSKDFGLLDEILSIEAVEEKNEDAKIGEFCGEKHDVFSSGLEGVVVGESMKNEEIGDESELILMNDGSEQNDAAVGGERLAANAEISEKELESEVIEERSEDSAIYAGKDKVYESKVQMLSGGVEDMVIGEKLKSAVELANDDIAIPQNEEGQVGSINEDVVIGTVEELSKENEGGEFILRDETVGDNAAAAAADDDDWEGIERSELERVFAGAINYVEYGGRAKDKQLVSLGSDVLMQLYGLHKLALEGPCHEPQPMAFKVSARAKWNAWQKLGSMSPEVAMEEYIKILSDTDPGWMLRSSAEDHKLGVYSGSHAKLSSIQDPQANFEVGRMKNEKVD